MDGRDAHVHQLTSLPERTQLVANVSLNTWICPCIHSLLDIALHQSTYLSGLVTQPKANACATIRELGNPGDFCSVFSYLKPGERLPNPCLVLLN